MDVAQDDAGVEGGGDERMAQRVGADLLIDPAPLGESLDDPSRPMPIQAAGPVPVEEDGSLFAFTNTEVDGAGGAGSEGDGDDLATLTPDGEGPMPPLRSEMFDVRAERFGVRRPLSANRHPNA